VRLRMAAASGEGVKPDPDPYRMFRDERERMNERARQDVADILGAELAMQLPGAAEKAKADRASMMPAKGEGSPIGKSSSERGKGGKGELREAGKETPQRANQRPATSPSTAE
jgi:hypothetical protein